MEFLEIWPYLSWNIKDISNLNRISRGDIIVKGYRFYVKLQKKFCRYEKEDCLELHLGDAELRSKDDCSFAISTYLKDTRGENHFIQRSLIIRTNSMAERLIWRVTLLDLFENSSLNWKENLHFVCMFGPESQYQKGFQGESFDSSHLCSYKDRVVKLSQEISRLYIRRSNGDVFLNCEGKKILADKNILSVRSPVFRKLFKNEIDQQTPTEVTISDVDYNNLKYLLAFLYSGSVLFYDQTVDGAMQLYQAAQKYQVLGLQEECRKFLVRNLKDDTAYRFLVFASEKNDEAFLNSVISFINKNDILKSKGWIEFSNEHPDLALETYFKYLDNYILARSNLKYFHKIS